jgi:hypothetical protein
MNQHSYPNIDMAIRKIDLDKRQVFEDRVNRYFNDMRGQEEEDEPLPEDEELASKALACKPNLHLDIKQFIIKNKEVVTNGICVHINMQGELWRESFRGLAVHGSRRMTGRDASTGTSTRLLTLISYFD